jgi:tRNA A-37 threonylcarbamoyl transferase component Bud32
METSWFGLGILGLACVVTFVLVACVFVVALAGRRRPTTALASSGTHWCPSCNAELPNDAPEGLCPRCLLKEGLRTPPPVASPPLPIRLPTRQYQEPTAARAIADLAARFPQLELIDFIGMGGMGEVYKARQTKLDRAVALKILSPESGVDSAFADRFTREARALAKLNHSNIVGIYDFGDADGLFYFLMEYVDGMNLRQLMQAGRLEPQQALAIVAQICDALQYAHDEGIVHRDIKPENILLDQRGRVKIADFGLAKLLHRTPVDFSLTGTRQVMGTIHYMAPEQIEKPQSVDHRADIYSLGVLFYEMLTGELPLGRFGLPSERAGTDARLDEIVLHALEKEPDRRYQRVSEVRTAVEALAGASPGLSLTAIPTSSNMQKDDDFYDNARSKVAIPAILLQVYGALGFLVSLFGIQLGITSHEFMRNTPYLFWGAIAGVGAAVVIFIGGNCMYRLRAWGMAVTATILCLASGLLTCVPLGLVGIWPLIVVLNADVKRAFSPNRIRPRRKAAPISPLSNLDLEMVRLQAIGPAASLIVTGILGMIFWAAMALMFVIGKRDWWSVTYYDSASHTVYLRNEYLWPDLGTGAIGALCLLVVVGPIFLGSRRLMKLETPGWVFLAIILCMLPWSPAVVLGLPVGIWALFVVNRPAVKMAFARHALGSRQEATPTPWNSPPIEQQPTGPFRRRMRSMLLGIQSLFVGSRAEAPHPTTPYSPPVESQGTGDSLK